MSRVNAERFRHFGSVTVRHNLSSCPPLGRHSPPIVTEVHRRARQRHQCASVPVGCYQWGWPSRYYHLACLIFIIIITICIVFGASIIFILIVVCIKSVLRECTPHHILCVVSKSYLPYLEFSANQQSQMLVKSPLALLFVRDPNTRTHNN